MKRNGTVWFGVILLGLSSAPAGAVWEVDLESGRVASGYNVARIPGEGGTQISLSDSFALAPAPFVRLKAYYYFNEEHALGALYAPLSLRGTGSVPYDIRFENEVLPAHAPLEALYRFNSYRLMYRYRFWKVPTAEAWLGFTAKIRDAEISLSGAGRKAQKLDVGFVPIINFKLEWEFFDPWSLVLDGDALAAPQGRAEDVLLVVGYRADEHWRIRLGYRGIEGGGDNKAVYTFAAIHYVVVGVVASF